MSIIFAYIAVSIFLAFEVWFWVCITIQTFKTENRALAIIPAGFTAILVGFYGIMPFFVRGGA